MSTTGKLLHLTPDHSYWAQVLEWDTDHFARPWSVEDWQKLDLNHHDVLVWFQENEPVGFALFGSLPGDEAAHLYKIFVKPSVRGSNAASNFMNAAKLYLLGKGFFRIYLEVETENKRAIGFYMKMGFTSLRVIKAYYSDGMDALTMDLTL